MGVIAKQKPLDTSHLKDEELLSFAKEELPYPRQHGAMTHVRECDHCTERVRRTKIDNDIYPYCNFLSPVKLLAQKKNWEFNIPDNIPDEDEEEINLINLDEGPKEDE